MRIYMAMVHIGADCRHEGGTKNVDARKKSRYTSVAPSRFAYIRSTVCDDKKRRKTGERRKSIVSVAAARMTINLHRIMIHVSIKNRLTAKRRYYIWVFRVPARIIPRIRVMHARKPACARRNYIWYSNQKRNELAPAAE